MTWEYALIASIVLCGRVRNNLPLFQDVRSKREVDGRRIETIEVRKAGAPDHAPLPEECHTIYVTSPFGAAFL